MSALETAQAPVFTRACIVAASSDAEVSLLRADVHSDIAHRDRCAQTPLRPSKGLLRRMPQGRLTAWRSAGAEGHICGRGRLREDCPSTSAKGSLVYFNHEQREGFAVKPPSQGQRIKVASLRKELNLSGSEPKSAREAFFVIQGLLRMRDARDRAPLVPVARERRVFRVADGSEG